MNLTILSFLFFFNIHTPTDTLHWSENRKLTYNDFKVRLNTTEGNVAQTASGISISYEYNQELEKYVIEVYSFFTFSDSWMHKDGKNEYVLNHEQKHFDITEIYARRLRKELSETNINYKNIRTVTSQLYNKILDDWNARQTLYDTQTYHGLRRSIQEEWDKKISQELEDLKLYAI